MPMIEYRAWKPNDETKTLLDRVIVVVEEYEASGFDMTVRQVYYQMVARGFIPNTTQSYGKLKRIIDRARLAGLIDWNNIVDRTRNVHQLGKWRDVPHFVFNASGWYRTDRWKAQDVRFEVWVEKEALSGVFQGICDELHVPLLACRGYLSSSAMWRAARRLEPWYTADQFVTILHFGDHDPSGIDMSRDNRVRQFLFDHSGVLPGHVSLERMALNMEQVDEFTPPNPAKLTDPRGTGYVERFGEVSWELDALQPGYLADLVRQRVLRDRDEEAWAAATTEDDTNERRLKIVSERWTDVVDALGLEDV